MDGFCKYCGQPISSEQKFCTNCGAENVLNEDKKSDIGPVTYTSGNEKKTEGSEAEKTNNKNAIIGFVCSIIGLFIAGFVMGFVAIGLGASVLKHNKVFGVNEGKGLAIAGIVIGILDIVFVMFGMVVRIFADM